MLTQLLEDGASEQWLNSTSPQHLPISSGFALYATLKEIIFFLIFKSFKYLETVIDRLLKQAWFFFFPSHSVIMAGMLSDVK